MEIRLQPGIASWNQTFDRDVKTRATRKARVRQVTFFFFCSSFGARDLDSWTATEGGEGFLGRAGCQPSLLGGLVNRGKCRWSLTPSQRGPDDERMKGGGSLVHVLGTRSENLGRMKFPQDAHTRGRKRVSVCGRSEGWGPTEPATEARRNKSADSRPHNVLYCTLRSRYVPK